MTEPMTPAEARALQVVASTGRGEAACLHPGSSIRGFLLRQAEHLESATGMTPVRTVEGGNVVQLRPVNRGED